MQTTLVRKHIRRLVLLSFLSRSLVYAFAYWASYLPLFDASPTLIHTSVWARPLLRWDAFHFIHIAEQGYLYEHDWAFFPGLSFVLRLFSNTDMLLAGALVAMACDTTTVLYRLSLHHSGSPNLAFLTALLSLLPSSPAALRLAPYTEPFFTYLSYRGMLYCAHSKWLLATVCFSFASAFRSNGIFLSGFILWGLLIQHFLETGKLPLPVSYAKSIFYTAMIFSPFIHHQLTGYLAFCTTSDPAPWCSNAVPLIYSHVQSAYWDNGFLRYWTLAQLPNFVIAAPPLAAIFTFSIHSLKTRNAASPITPHAIHALVIGCMLLFLSNVQIVLRMGPSMPLNYWAAAWLVMEHPKMGKLWVGWSVLWGAISVVLWSVFLPPA